ncbi:MAG: penicillin-binding protein 2 [Desulfobacterales bacterium]|nr:penicillin-binding protein 2 [Desulfobacterales bacterium]
MNRYLQNADGDWFKRRLSGVIFCAVVAFVVLMVRVFYLQVMQGEELRRLSDNNCIRLQGIDAPRGLIFDRNGKRLVDNRPAFDVGVIVKDARPLEQTLARLAGYLDLDEAELRQRLAHRNGEADYKPVIIERDISRDTLAVLEAHKFDLPGVVVNVVPRRNYIYETSAAHLLGYLGEVSGTELQKELFPGARAGDFIGKSGVEKAFEKYLKGERGGRQVEVNANGQVVRVLKTVEATPGKNIFLTIDKELQRKAETLLEGIAGAVVAMDPSTGEVLAIASSPTFDQNDFVSGLSNEVWDGIRSNPFRPLENKAIQGNYPPASTYKIITAIAGLEEGVIDENTTFTCPGHYRMGNRTFRCWKRGGHGRVNVVEAIEKSCDVFFYQVGQKLGVDRLAWYAKACGLGVPAGIDIAHEAAGLVPTADWKKQRTGVSWQAGETLSVAIGQGYNLTTPLQMLGLTAAVGNGGTRLRPLILKSLQNPNGETLFSCLPEEIGQLPVSPKTLDIVRRGLWRVVNQKTGTAWVAHTAGIDICGKTGTAQVFSRKNNETLFAKDRPAFLNSHAWFVAYAPAVNPRIAVAVIVEHGEHGSNAASPIARELVKTYLRSPLSQTVADGAVDAPPAAEFQMPQG